MKLRKKIVVLLELLLAAMAIIPMVSATDANDEQIKGRLITQSK